MTLLRILLLLATGVGLVAAGVPRLRDLQNEEMVRIAPCPPKRLLPPPVTLAEKLERGVQAVKEKLFGDECENRVKREIEEVNSRGAMRVVALVVGAVIAVFVEHLLLERLAGGWRAYKVAYAAARHARQEEAAQKARRTATAHADRVERHRIARVWLINKLGAASSYLTQLGDPAHAPQADFIRHLIVTELREIVVKMPLSELLELIRRNVELQVKVANVAGALERVGIQNEDILLMVPAVKRQLLIT
jgi:hypothetical protein